MNKSPIYLNHMEDFIAAMPPLWDKGPDNGQAQIFLFGEIVWVLSCKQVKHNEFTGILDSDSKHYSQLGLVSGAAVSFQITN